MIKEYLHKVQMRKNTIENIIDTLKEENSDLKSKVIKLQEDYIRVVITNQKLKLEKKEIIKNQDQERERQIKRGKNGKKK